MTDPVIPVMAIKSRHVRINNLSPTMARALLRIAVLYSESGYELVVTSGGDGAHSSNSRHYADPVEAVDLRFWMVPASRREAFALKIRRAIGTAFDVVVEKHHYHIEHDPKPGDVAA